MIYPVHKYKTKSEYIVSDSVKLGFLTCGMRHALGVMRYAVRYAACVIPLIRHAASFSFFSFLRITK